MPPDIPRNPQGTGDEQWPPTPSPTLAIAELDTERNELAQTWKWFNSHLPPEDRVVDGDARPQTAHDIVDLVRKTQTYWMSRPRQRVYSQASALCDRLLPTLDTHSALLSVLPESSLYALLFYGVLQSLLKATVNCPHLMEGLITILLDIHNTLNFPGGTLPPTDAAAPIAKIYAVTFFLLSEFMDYYVRRSTCKSLKSHNQDVYAEFDHLVHLIQRRARDLPWRAEDRMELDEEESVWETLPYNARALWEETRLSQIGRQGTERRIAAQNTITRRLIWDIQQNAEDRERIRNEREHLLAQALSALSQQLQPVEQSSGIACLSTAAVQNLDTSQFEWSRGSKRRLARLELQSASKHLQAYFDNNDQIADVEPEVKVAAEGSVIASLKQWATSLRSQALAVGGSPTVSPSPVALTSACYASFARQARLPVISHFCSLPTQEVQGLTPQEQGDAVLDLGAERFRQLDGKLGSWKAALSLIDTLVHFAPPLLVCVIDGLDLIIDTSTDAPIRELVRVLVTHTHQAILTMPDGTRSPGALLKVLFTVTGRPAALVETMSENHLLLSESSQSSEPAPSDPVLASDVGVVMMNA
ncbi:hypothetical protein N7510_010019 [Penicillium lagena]|uniref:uncharacterized protein n=1 Tax=Penicillium lagena TaxID=94218 RepID=UPI00253FC3C8|nr:uncharacterized protein N7510_010019 [Penicillium lagena]KAJ5604865.1 hypothetical protein N7510_010019 [Penicillium lagena]